MQIVRKLREGASQRPCTALACWMGGQHAPRGAWLGSDAGQHPLLVELCLQLCSSCCGWHVGEGRVLRWDGVIHPWCICLLLHSSTVEWLPACDAVMQEATQQG